MPEKKVVNSLESVWESLQNQYRLLSRIPPMSKQEVGKVLNEFLISVHGVPDVYIYVGNTKILNPKHPASYEFWASRGK